MHSGQVKVPPGYHPIDVEKEWGRLHVAILERERLLRIEFERLERQLIRNLLFIYLFFVLVRPHFLLHQSNRNNTIQQ